MKKIIYIILIFCGLLGQAQPMAEDVKVGLVLSGGGAKGFAHIGVLKVIDSLGIKVDYIAGTSMGATIGSLYAAGYSGKELDSIFKTTDFDRVINDKFPREVKSLKERENSEKYIISLPFDNFDLTLPSAISRGQNVYDLLYRLMLPVNEIKDFSELPIPFFCIATNIETGESVYLDKGNLAQAVAASGAFPSLFQPIYIDGQLLIDGGVTNNYPIEELRAKGMDVIIGVDVQDGLRDREALKAATDILLQINNFRTIEDMVDKSKVTDIYIKPDIENFSVISFNEGEDIIKNGELAAQKKLDELIVLQHRLGAPKPPQSRIVIPDSLTINAVFVKGNERYTRSYILGKLKLKKLGKISYEKFKKGVSALVATNNFESFNYEFIPSKDKNGYDLMATVRESEGSTFLKAGLHYDDLYKSAALLNVTKKRLLFKNDIASVDLILGDNIRYNLEYYIDKGFYWSVGFNSRYNEFHKNITPFFVLSESDPIAEELNKIDVELSDFTNQIYVETIFRKDFTLRLGAEHKKLKLKSETLLSENQDEDIIFENSDYYSVFGTLKLDTFSDKYFPESGVYFEGDFHWYLNGNGMVDDFASFAIAKADIGYVFSFSDKLALKIATQGGFQIGNDTTRTLDFALGGYGNNFINNFQSFYGYDFVSLTGDSFVKALIDIDYEIFKKHHIVASANIANIEDNIFESGEWFSSPDYTGYALGYGFDSFLGPLEAKFSYSPELDESIWFFSLGFWF